MRPHDWAPCLDGNPWSFDMDEVFQCRRCKWFKAFRMKNPKDVWHWPLHHAEDPRWVRGCSDDCDYALVQNVLNQ